MWFVLIVLLYVFLGFYVGFCGFVILELRFGVCLVVICGCFLLYLFVFDCCFLSLYIGVVIWWLVVCLVGLGMISLCCWFRLDAWCLLWDGVFGCVLFRLLISGCCLVWFVYCLL